MLLFMKLMKAHSGYNPPRQYKLVVFFPDESRFLESDFYIREEFEEKYIVDLNQTDVNGKLLLEKEAYDWIGAIFSTIFRVTLTLVV